MFPADLLGFIILAAILVLTGLAVKILASALGLASAKGGFLMDGEMMESLLIRKSRLGTFLRIYGWNIAVSSMVIISGMISLGVIPAAWAFINLGFFFPDLNIFRVYVYPWVEEPANILSVALGMWIGRNLTVLLSGSTVLPWIVMVMLGIYMISALLEAYEIHGCKGLIIPEL